MSYNGRVWGFEGKEMETLENPGHTCDDSCRSYGCKQASAFRPAKSRSSKSERHSCDDSCRSYGCKQASAFRPGNPSLEPDALFATADSLRRAARRELDPEKRLTLSEQADAANREAIEIQQSRTPRRRRSRNPLDANERVKIYDDAKRLHRRAVEAVKRGNRDEYDGLNRIMGEMAGLHTAATLTGDEQLTLEIGFLQNDLHEMGAQAGFWQTYFHGARFLPKDVLPPTSPKKGGFRKLNPTDPTGKDFSAGFIFWEGEGDDAQNEAYNALRILHENDIPADLEVVPGDPKTFGTWRYRIHVAPPADPTMRMIYDGVLNRIASEAMYGKMTGVWQSLKRPAKGWQKRKSSLREKYPILGKAIEDRKKREGNPLTRAETLNVWDRATDHHKKLVHFTKFEMPETATYYAGAQAEATDIAKKFGAAGVEIDQPPVDFQRIGSRKGNPPRFLVIDPKLGVLEYSRAATKNRVDGLQRARNYAQSVANQLGRVFLVFLDLHNAIGEDEIDMERVIALGAIEVHPSIALENPSGNPPRFIVIDAQTGVVQYTKTATKTGDEALRKAHVRAQDMANKLGRTFLVFLDLHNAKVGAQVSVEMVVALGATEVHPGAGRGENPGHGGHGIPPHIENDPAFQKEMKAYRRRHGSGPVEIRTVQVPKGYPKFMSVYGEAPHAVYDAPSHSIKGKRIHHFGKKGTGKPWLVSSASRGPKFLAYVGGKFRAGTDWLYD
jgi:hypothetical protein